MTVNSRRLYNALVGATRMWRGRGKWRVASWVQRLLPQNTVVSAADGRRFHIRPDPIYARLIADADHNFDETEMYRSLLTPGQTVLDVGANYGFYT
ncbi:MAG: hypothetical protein AAFQ82_26065, partial [Myxococcota bacterium]